jgi:hypothetical protein
VVFSAKPAPWSWLMGQRGVIIPKGMESL